ncbi:MAG: hypothetical protein QXP78_01680 [Candidatus Bathyarchaeia archaeon]
MELKIFIVIWLAMIANSFWESYVEGRNTMELGKLGWKIKIGRYFLTGYHFNLFFVMWPLILSLPLIINGWDSRLFGIILSAYISGLIVEDFVWFVVNPAVKLSEFWSEFTDHYPWIKINDKKIIPKFYEDELDLYFEDLIYEIKSSYPSLNIAIANIKESNGSFFVTYKVEF